MVLVDTNSRWKLCYLFFLLLLSLGSVTCEESNRDLLQTGIHLRWRLTVLSPLFEAEVVFFLFVFFKADYKKRHLFLTKASAPPAEGKYR